MARGATLWGLRNASLLVLTGPNDVKAVAKPVVEPDSTQQWIGPIITKTRAAAETSTEATTEESDQTLFLDKTYLGHTSPTMAPETSIASDNSSDNKPLQVNTMPAEEISTPITPSDDKSLNKLRYHRLSVACGK